MKFNEILNEVDVEFGNGKSVGIIPKLSSKKSYIKTGDRDTTTKKTVDINNYGSEAKQSIQNIINYLKKNNLWTKVATKQNFDSSDVVMKADGSAVINFDDGGSIRLPSSVLSAPITPEQKQNFLSKLKNAINASVDAEEAGSDEVEESYFPY